MQEWINKLKWEGKKN